MPFEVLINPHNVTFGSTAVLGVTAVAYDPVSLGPQVHVADDGSVAVTGRSSHDAHSGTVTLADPTQARALAAQAGPATFSFDCEASDGGADASYSFADAQFSEPFESVGTGQAAGCTLRFSAKTLTVT